ncbi:MAG: sulfite oxidase heme-binding subunit YedZ [Bryobacteraceae bacterium]
MLRRRWVKPLVWVLCLAPFAWLAGRVSVVFGLIPADAIGGVFSRGNPIANPLEYITHFTGDWTIRFLVFTLAVTPLRKLLRLPDLIRFRRMLGLFAFFYGSCHFLTWLWLDKLFDVHEMLKDVAKRPFITAGFTALVLMLPLAATSTAGSIRRLGGKRWRALHRLVYLSAIAGVVHYYWLVKSDVRLPVFYGTLVGLLLLYRVVVWMVAEYGRRGAVVKQRTAAPV